MYSLNRATVLGNLTRDPELRQTPNGQSVCSFGVATNRAWNGPDGKRQEQTEFHNVVAWGKLAEICGQYLTKGKKVYVEGRLQTRDWEGQDAVKRYRTEIVAENLIMLDRAGAGAGAGAAGGNAQNAFSTQPEENFTPPAPQDTPSMNPDDEIKVEDIPF